VNYTILSLAHSNVICLCWVAVQKYM